MTYLITKDFAFSAAHHLNDLPPEHKCGRLHGHNYIVRVELFSDSVDYAGFVLDYGQLAPLSRFIDDKLDHRYLNDVLPALGGPSQPSAELMAAWLRDALPDMLSDAGADLPDDLAVAVGVSETPKCWAWAR